MSTKTFVTHDEILTKNNMTEYTPIESFHPSTKKYVDDEIAQALVGGDVDLSNYLAKDNIIEYTPSADYHPATKKYVDNITEILNKEKQMINETLNLGDSGVSHKDYNVPNGFKCTNLKLNATIGKINGESFNGRVYFFAQENVDDSTIPLLTEEFEDGETIIAKIPEDCVMFRISRAASVDYTIDVEIVYEGESILEERLTSLEADKSIVTKNTTLISPATYTTIWNSKALVGLTIYTDATDLTNSYQLVANINGDDAYQVDFGVSSSDNKRVILPGWQNAPIIEAMNDGDILTLEIVGASGKNVYIEETRINEKLSEYFDTSSVTNNMLRENFLPTVKTISNMTSLNGDVSFKTNNMSLDQSFSQCGCANFIDSPCSGSGYGFIYECIYVTELSGQNSNGPIFTSERHQWFYCLDSDDTTLLNSVWRRTIFSTNCTSDGYSSYYDGAPYFTATFLDWSNEAWERIDVSRDELEEVKSNKKMPAIYYSGYRSLDRISVEFTISDTETYEPWVEFELSVYNDPTGVVFNGEYFYGDLTSKYLVQPSSDIESSVITRSQIVTCEGMGDFNPSIYMRRGSSGITIVSQNEDGSYVCTSDNNWTNTAWVRIDAETETPPTLTSVTTDGVAIGTDNWTGTGYFCTSSGTKYVVTHNVSTATSSTTASAINGFNRFCLKPAEDTQEWQNWTPYFTYNGVSYEFFYSPSRGLYEALIPATGLTAAQVIAYIEWKHYAPTILNYGKLRALCYFDIKDAASGTVTEERRWIASEPILRDTSGEITEEDYQKAQWFIGRDWWLELSSLDVASLSLIFMLMDVSGKGRIINASALYLQNMVMGSITRLPIETIDNFS